jgi:hypothetical protein
LNDPEVALLTSGGPRQHLSMVRLRPGATT